MRKSTRLLKRLVALSLVLLLSIESFAAVVGDNDGAAFITKAEFDSLKSSFQEQINRYNKSIDNKIDGAIASYLDGVRLAKTEAITTFYSPVEGVLSISSDAFPWTEGKMDVALFGTLFRYNTSSNQGLFNFNANSNGGSPFYETLVYDINESGYARFGGYKKTEQYSTFNGQDFGAWQFRQGTYGTIVTAFGGTFPVSNTILTTDDSHPLMIIGFYNNVCNEDFYYWNQLRFYGKQCSFRREIKDGDSNTFFGGLILNTSSMAHKFSNNDQISDWCNDTTTDGHTAFTKWEEQNWTGTATSYKINNVSNVTITDVNLDSTTTYTTDSRAEGGTRRRLYFGFANQVGDWNKIYDANLDGLYDYILPDTDTNKSKNTIVNKSANHIKLGAGLPIVEVDEDDKVTYEFDFKDKTMDYAVWVKIGSFDSTKNMADDKDDVITQFTTYGDTQYVDGWKALKIVNGTGKCSFKAEKKGVVFMKWSLASTTSTNGGGLLYPAKKVLVEHGK